MPRSRGGSGRSRPSAPAGSRSSSTVAAPPVQSKAAPPPPAAAQAGQANQPGLLSQMASTAGGVAAGSVIGHGISSMLFGGRGEAAAAPASAQTTSSGGSCEFQSKEFTKCLDAADVQTCSWFLEQLKACQAAASQY